MRVRKFCHPMSAVALGLCCLLWTVPGEADHRPKILFFNSYHQGFAWSDSIVDGVQEVFANAELDVDLSIEYLDTKRQSLESLSPYLGELLHHKYRGQHFDLHSQL